MTKEYVGYKDPIGDGLYNMGLTDEEVIRCRDCKKFETMNCAVYRALRADDRVDEHGMFNPDGFCAWGERDA